MFFSSSIEDKYIIYLMVCISSMSEYLKMLKMPWMCLPFWYVCVEVNWMTRNIFLSNQGFDCSKCPSSLNIGQTYRRWYQWVCISRLKDWWLILNKIICIYMIKCTDFHIHTQKTLWHVLPILSISTQT